MCGSLLPASVLQAPTQLWLEEGPDLGAGLAAPLSAGLPGVQAAGKDVRAPKCPIVLQDAWRSPSNQPGLCGRLGPGGRGPAQGLAGVGSRARGPGHPEPPSPLEWKLLFK